MMTTQTVQTRSPPTLQPSEDNGQHAFWDVAHSKGSEFAVYSGDGAVTRIMDKVWLKQKSVNEGLNELDKHLTKLLRKEPASV